MAATRMARTPIAEPERKAAMAMSTMVNAIASRACRAAL
jgi:hypothetical protein